MTITTNGETLKGAQQGAVYLGIGDNTIVATAMTDDSASVADQMDLFATGDLVLSFDAHEEEWDVNQMDAYSLVLRPTIGGQPLSAEQMELANLQLACSNSTIETQAHISESGDAWVIRVQGAPEDPYDIRTGATSITAGATLKIGEATLNAENVTTAANVGGVPFWRSVLNWLKRNWWWIASLIAITMAAIIYLRTKALPNKVLKDGEADFSIGGRAIPSSVTVGYNLRSGVLRITAPQGGAQYPLIACSIIIDVAAVDPRSKKSSRRGMEVKAVKGGADIPIVNIGSATYMWDKTQNAYIKDGSAPTIIKSGSEIEIRGMATTNTGRPKTANLRQTLKFK